jgi:prepilin-type N-terminal cleavage/methylation domain-containing protein
MSVPDRTVRPPDGPLADDRGYTLIEMLIVMALSIIVVGVPMAFVVLSLNQQNVGSSRAAAVQQEAVGLGRLTRDLRQVVPNTTSTFTWSPTAASASMTLPVPGTGGASNESVVWSCSFASAGTGTCTRSVNSGSPVLEVRNVDSLSFAPVDDAGNALASAATNPSYVGITLQVQGTSQLDASGTTAATGIQHPITLTDGVDLRNNT